MTVNKLVAYYQGPDAPNKKGEKVPLSLRLTKERMTQLEMIAEHWDVPKTTLANHALSLLIDDVFEDAVARDVAHHNPDFQLYVTVDYGDSDIHSYEMVYPNSQEKQKSFLHQEFIRRLSETTS